MRGSSRHGPSRPERGGGSSADPRAGRSGRRGSTPGRSGAGSGPGAADRGRHQPAAKGRQPAAVDSAALAGVIEPVVSAAGMDLEAVRVGSAGRRLLVRVVVDADGGVALDDIADVSRELSAALDAHAALGEAPYTLEVSSPGVDRPLTEPRHWRRAVGRLVRSGLPATAPPGAPAGAGSGAVEGRVVAATDAEVTIDVGGDRRVFSYAELGPGRVQVEFGRADQDGGLDGGEPDGH